MSLINELKTVFTNHVFCVFESYACCIHHADEDGEQNCIAELARLDYLALQSYFFKDEEEAKQIGPLFSCPMPACSLAKNKPLESPAMALCQAVNVSEIRIHGPE